MKNCENRNGLLFVDDTEKVTGEYENGIRSLVTVIVSDSVKQQVSFVRRVP